MGDTAGLFGSHRGLVSRYVKAFHRANADNFARYVWLLGYEHSCYDSLIVQAATVPTDVDIC